MTALRSVVAQDELADEHLLVVVVTYNSADLLPDLVASLRVALDGLSWHLVVADNDSTDRSVLEARRLAPEATVLDLGHNGGYAAGINAAVSAAPAHTAVLVLNPDVRVGPDCVRVLLAGMRRSRAGIVVPRLDDARGDLIHSMRRRPTVLRTLADALLGATRAGRIGSLGEVVTAPSAYAVESSTDWAEGSTQLVSAECWSACGRWDESYFLYSEETDFHLRAHDLGFDVRYLPTARAVHLEGGSATSARLWPLLVANRLKIFGARHGWWHTRLFWLALLAREGTRAVLGRATSRAAAQVLLRPRTLRAPRGPEWLDEVSASA